MLPHNLGGSLTTSHSTCWLTWQNVLQEYCSGGTLREAVDCGLFRRLPRRWDAILKILLDIAAGMEYMHANRICHSDLNPANILLKVRSGQLAASNLKTGKKKPKKPKKNQKKKTLPTGPSPNVLQHVTWSHTAVYAARCHIGRCLANTVCALVYRQLLYLWCHDIAVLMTVGLGMQSPAG